MSKIIRIHVSHFRWDKRGVMTRGKETIIYKMTDEVKNLTMRSYLVTEL